MATRPGCLHGFNSGVKCKCYSPRVACHKSLLPLSSLNFTFPSAKSCLPLITAHTVVILHFHQDFFIYEVFCFYVHVDAVHIYTALSFYVFETSRNSENTGKATLLSDKKYGQSILMRHITQVIAFNTLRQ